MGLNHLGWLRSVRIDGEDRLPGLLVDDDALEESVVYARLASVALLQAREISGLRSALGNRLLIGAAQGILMERYGLTMGRAFEVLRRHSNDTNTKLHDVAQGVADGITLRSS